MKRIVITPSITRRDEEALATYFEEISKSYNVTPDEEATLARRIRQGDEAALERLVKANLRFVVSVAKTYQGQGMPLSDLIEEGNVGLVTAARRFDETRGFKFITYAVWWIRQSILQALNDNSRMVRLPNNQNQLLRLILSCQNHLLQEQGYPPTDEEVGDELGVTAQRVREVLQANQRSQSFDAPLTDEDGGTLLDVLADTEAEATDAAASHLALSDELRDVFSRTLKDRDIYVLINSFGIGCRERSHEEIGMDLGLTRERVRQIRERAILKLRNSRHSQRLRDFC